MGESSVSAMYGNKKIKETLLYFIDLYHDKKITEIYYLHELFNK